MYCMKVISRVSWTSHQSEILHALTFLSLGSGEVYVLTTNSLTPFDTTGVVYRIVDPNRYVSGCVLLFLSLNKVVFQF